jgi:hypothetical protein
MCPRFALVPEVIVWRCRYIAGQYQGTIDDYAFRR